MNGCVFDNKICNLFASRYVRVEGQVKFYTDYSGSRAIPDQCLDFSIILFWRMDNDFY